MMLRQITRVITLNTISMVGICLLWFSLAVVLSRDPLAYLFSAFSGCIVFLIPFLVYTMYAFRTCDEALTPGIALYNIIYGVILKYSITILMFIGIFLLIDTVHQVFIFSYIISVVCHAVTSYYLQ